MLDFYYEIDKKLFDKVFVYPILRQFINFVEAFCSDPSKKSKQIEYLELVYNRLFIFKPTVFEIGEKLDFQDQERLIVETYEKSIPFIKNYTLTRIMETTSLRGSLECYLFVKEKRIEYILKLLMSKENTLVKPIDYCEGFRLEKDLFLSWEQTQKEHLSDKESTLRLALIKENFGESNQTRRRLDHGLFRIDYVEALKYKELIEKDIKNSEDDLFLNL
ncbi:hypothetical protein [Paenibacillus polymyxa]|uniref:hypothetical protein n=1 Tax=Paenibacillus polymyxa TaxID=1406 RepID=UPI0003D2EB31|nr:hypothetical protein [Paenibacillus polymyxa]